MRKHAKRRQPRRLVNPLALAVQQATKLTAAEVSQQMGPCRLAFDALRQGRATLRQWQIMAATLTIAASIEKLGVVKGLAGLLAEVDEVLDAIEGRAVQGLTAGGWRAPVLRGEEIRQLQEFLRVHQFQLEQLSYREYRQACAQAVARVRCGGGAAIDLRAEDYA